MSIYEASYPGDDIAAALIEAVSPSGDKKAALAQYDALTNSPEAKKRLREWAEQDYGDEDLEEKRRVLLPALLLMELRHGQASRQWTQIFRRLLTDLDIERSIELRGPGLPQLRPRGAMIVRDNAPGERFIYLLEPHELALGTALLKEADGSWMDFATPGESGERERTDIISVIVPLMFGMVESFVQAEEILHANVLNTGNVYNPTYCGDCVPLFSDGHPIDTGVYSNRCDKNLNELSLEQVSALIKALPLQSGQVRAMARARKLVVPIAHEFRAARLMKDMLAADPGLYPEGYCVLDFLDYPPSDGQSPWYVLTTIGGLISMERKPFKLDLRVEDDKLVLEGTHAYNCGYNNPRAIFASYPNGAMP